jgi:hypothetical protein
MYSISELYDVLSGANSRCRNISDLINVKLIRSYREQFATCSKNCDLVPYVSKYLKNLTTQHIARRFKYKCHKYAVTTYLTLQCVFLIIKFT